MRTTTISVEKIIPLLQITHDEDADSPRDNDTLSLMDIREHRRYTFPKELSIQWDEWEDTVNQITALESTHYIFPIDSYEHSGISFSILWKWIHCRFDSSKSVGIIAVPREYNSYDNKEYSISKNLDKPTATKIIVTQEQAETIATEEIENYNRYLNWEIYRFDLFDNDGDIIDSCGGFYSIDDIKWYLPDEWKDEDLNQYLVY